MSYIAYGRLPGDSKIDPNIGFQSQALGHRASLDWLHLRLPWWNPYQGTGAPLAGEMKSAAFFPPTLLTLYADGQLYEHLLLELVAGFATYLLLRRIGVGRLAGAAAAIAYALNGTFAWFGDAPVNPIPFLPALLLGIELAYDASVKNRRGGWWLLGLAGALSFYAGFPEVAYLDALLAVWWLAWRAGCLRRERARLGAFIRKAITGTVVGALLAAPLLIASVDYLRHAELAGHGSAHYGNVRLPQAALSQLLLPYVYGPIFAFRDSGGVIVNVWGQVGGYLSTSLLLFALVGVTVRSRRGLAIALVSWTALAVARIYGQPSGLDEVLGVVPGMSRVSFFRYAFPALELAVVVLAALGLDELQRARYSRRWIGGAALLSLGIVALTALNARPIVRDIAAGHHEYTYLTASALWGAAVVLAGAALFFLRNRRLRLAIAAVVVAGEALLLFVVPMASAPRRVHLDLAPVSFLQRQLGYSRFFTLSPLQPNYGSYFGIGALNVNDIPIPKPFARYVNARLDRVVDPTLFVGDYGGARPKTEPSPKEELLRNLDGYRAAAVAYVLTPSGQALPQSADTFTLVFRSPSTWIYRLAGAAPYVQAPGCRVTVRSRNDIGLSCRRRTSLVRRETDLPGWSASVDGHHARVQPFDGLFQSIAVGAGAHRITFSYRPPYVDWGYAAFAIGLGWLALVLVLEPVVRRRRVNRALR